MEREIREWTENLDPNQLKWLDHCLFDPTFEEWWQATVAHQLDPWQREVLCPLVEEWAVLDGVRIAFHAPPQRGKSEGTSERGPAYALGCNPYARVWEICHNIEKAAQFGEQVRNLMCTETFQKMFPRASEASVDPRASSEQFSTWVRKQLITSHRSFKAAGLLTGVAGVGPDKIMEDDPYAGPEEAKSKAINNRVDRTHTKGIRPRVKWWTCWFMMFHRYNPEDAIGRMLRRNWGFRYIRCPAEADENEDYSDPTTCCSLQERHLWETGQRRWFRMVGDMLSPRDDAAEVAATKEEDPELYWGQLQGRPIAAGGTEIRREWLKEAPRAPVIKLFVRFFDLAVGKKEGSDYTAGALGGIGVNPDNGKRTLYLTDMLRFRERWGMAQETIVEQILADKAWCDAIGADYWVGVEEVYWQDAMIQDLIRRLGERVKFMPVPSTSKKVLRAKPWIAWARLDMFRYVLGNWDHSAFIEEAILFTGEDTDRHDDQIDAISGLFQLIWWIVGQGSSKPEEPEETDTHGIIKRLREIAKERNRTGRGPEDEWDE